MIVSQVSFNLLFICLKDVLFTILLRFLAVKQHSRVKFFTFECILKKLNKAVVLNEHYYASSLFCLFDDICEQFQACFLQILYLFLAICCLMIENNLSVSNFLQNDHFTLLLLYYMRILFNNYLLPKFLKQASKIIKRLHGSTSYNSQPTFIDNFLQLITLQTQYFDTSFLDL